MAWSNSAIRVSRHSCLPNRNGEFAHIAICTPAMAWAAFQYAGNVSGLTCRWHCTLVQAASGAIESELVRSRSSPSMSSHMSSPRAAKICSLSSL